MSSIARLIFFITLIWVIAFGFAESIRIVRLNSEIRNDMEQMMEQALEAGLDHQALRSHLSLVSTETCYEEFDRMVQYKYNAQKHDTDLLVYMPRNENAYYEIMKIEPIFTPGSFSVSNGEHFQSSNSALAHYPTGTLQGIMRVKPLFFNVNDIKFDVKFKVEIDNFHAEHTDYALDDISNTW